MWITNGGKADFFTVFAKIGGEQFSAFLVERTFPGVSNGAEEKKMGIKGSSTTPVFFDNVPVPGREPARRSRPRPHHRVQHPQHRPPEARRVRRRRLEERSADLARLRERPQSLRHHHLAFRHDPAQAGRDGDSHLRRGIDDLSRRRPDRRAISKAFSWDEPDAARRMMKAVEEFAAECSIIKVYASEMLDYVVDEGVQIHGGYGYHQDYAVERAYRDSRINRIFEGTNEINRLLITGMLLKRAQQGRLGLVKAAKGLMDEVLSGPSAERPASLRTRRRSRCCCMAVAFEKFGAELEKQQEVLAGIADVIMETFAMESAQLRSQKNSNAADICAVLLPRRDGPHRNVRAPRARRLLRRRCAARQYGGAAPLREIRTRGFHRAAPPHRRAAARRRPLRGLMNR